MDRGIELCGSTAVTAAVTLEVVYVASALRVLAVVAELLGILVESPRAERCYLDSHGGYYRLGEGGRGFSTGR